jgi:hypothetical protein
MSLESLRAYATFEEEFRESRSITPNSNLCKVDESSPALERRERVQALTTPSFNLSIWQASQRNMLEILLLKLHGDALGVDKLKHLPFLPGFITVRHDWHFVAGTRGRS